MRCPACDNKESRLASILDLKGNGEDSISKSALSKSLLDLAASKKGQLDDSQIYCTWCGMLVYEDPQGV